MNSFAEFGEKLKQARIEKGIELAEIEMKTKIRLKYLLDIEKGEFGEIPGGEVYIKGFISNYAKAVGLDVKTVLDEYKLLASKGKEECEVTGMAHQDDTPFTLTMPSKPKFQVKYLLVFGAIIITAICALLFVNKTEDYPKTSPINIKETSEENLPPLEEQIHETSETEIEPETLEQLPEITKVKDDNSETVYAIKADSIKVRLKIGTERCWISVRSDDKKTTEKTLMPGETIEWTAQNELIIRIGNTNVSDITVNEVNLGVPGGRARNFIFRKME
jgi:cytoskeletal protein RodZ